MKKYMSLVLSVCMAVWLLLSGCGASAQRGDAAPAYRQHTQTDFAPRDAAAVSLAQVPDFSGRPYAVINNNRPGFTEQDMTEASFEQYSPLDSLGRCGAAFANVGRDIMPTEKRGYIGQVKPSGWKIAKYGHVDGKYLYNRCHLIGYQLTAENANERNLITGTRYMNVQGMLPFENMVADYVKETDNHVLYRVTPVFSGHELVARGVQIEALSVEDKGEGICFNVYCYNVQPGVVIDYATGNSRAEGTAPESAPAEGAGSAAEASYVLNKNSKKFHLPACSGARKIKDKNREAYEGTRGELLDRGYSPCGLCRP